MRILLHTCCADCLYKFVVALEKEFKIDTEIFIYFYNPNIHPRTEYLARLEALKFVFNRDIKPKHLSSRLIVADWKPKEYFDRIGEVLVERCPRCWSLRLNNVFEYALKNSFDVVSTTMLSSEYQYRNTIEKLGLHYAKKYPRIKFVFELFFDINVKGYGYYKQNYCGCVYSLNEKMLAKYKT